MPFGGAPECKDFWPPESLSLLTAIITGIISIVTVPGNILICLSMFKDPHGNLRTSFNCFVLNLAIADLLTGLIAEPLFVWFHAQEALHDSILGFKTVIHVCYFITSLASIQSIAALALDRYLTATSKYRRQFPLRKAINISIVIWVSSIAIAMIYFTTTFYKYGLIYSTVSTCFTLGIIVFSYARIYRTLHSHAIETTRSIKNVRVTQRIYSYEKKTTRAFLYILIVFTLTSIPSCSMVYVINFCSTCNCDVIHWLRDFHFLLALFNSACNQFLYALRMRRFIRAINTILKVIPCVPYFLNAVGIAHDQCNDTNTNDIKDLHNIEAAKSHTREAINLHTIQARKSSREAVNFLNRQ